MLLLFFKHATIHHDIGPAGCETQHSSIRGQAEGSEFFSLNIRGETVVMAWGCSACLHPHAEDKYLAMRS